MDYNKLEKLNELRQAGTLSEDEFESEKRKLLNESPSIEILGIAEKNYLGAMNFLLLIPGMGWALAIIAWAIGKDKSELVDVQGRNIASWILSSTLYSIILGFVLTNSINIGGNLNFNHFSNLGGLFSLLSPRVLPSLILLVLGYVFPIIGGLKGLQGISWYYPLAIPFFKKTK